MNREWQVSSCSPSKTKLITDNNNKHFLVLNQEAAQRTKEARERNNYTWEERKCEATLITGCWGLGSYPTPSSQHNFAHHPHLGSHQGVAQAKYVKPSLSNSGEASTLITFSSASPRISYQHPSQWNKLHFCKDVAPDVILPQNTEKAAHVYQPINTARVVINVTNVQLSTQPIPNYQSNTVIINATRFPLFLSCQSLILEFMVGEPTSLEVTGCANYRWNNSPGSLLQYSHARW